MRMRNLVVAFVLLVAAAGAATVYLYRQHEHGTPYLASPPTRALLGLTAVAKPSGHRPPTCLSSDGLPNRRVGKLAPRVWLDQDPSGGQVLWRPGLNSRTCRAHLQHLDRTRAAAIAVAVDHAPLPQGIRNCPMDDGSGATVFLRYQGKQDAEVVRVDLTGCGGLSAPGRAPREDGTTLSALGRAPAGMH